MNLIYPAETLLTRAAEWNQAGYTVRVLPPFSPAATMEAAVADHVSAMAVAKALGCQSSFDAEIHKEMCGEVEPNNARRRRDPHERLVDVYRLDSLLADPMPLD